MRVGVLALQGDFAAHGDAVARAGGEPVPVRTAIQIDGIDALVLPGGESTAMLHAIVRDGLETTLRAFLESGRPVLGTCAGAILLAHRVSGPAQRSFDALDVDLERNAYGTQLDSFTTVVDAGSTFEGLPAIFIRAPRFLRVGSGVEVLARVRGDAVLVRDGAIWAATFHPELAGDPRVLAAWLARHR